MNLFSDLEEKIRFRISLLGGCIFSSNLDLTQRNISRRDNIVLRYFITKIKNVLIMLYISLVVELIYNQNIASLQVTAFFRKKNPY